MPRLRCFFCMETVDFRRLLYVLQTLYFNSFFELVFVLYKLYSILYTFKQGCRVVMSCQQFEVKSSALNLKTYCSDQFDNILHQWI